MDALIDTVYACWAQPEREFHYVGADLFVKNSKRLRADDIRQVHAFVTMHSWWDTVDALASHAVGALVTSYPELTKTMDAWIDDADFWLARTAILHQLRFGVRTDEERLFRYALRRADDDEFFIRKAIGWSLRQYAKTEPDRVCGFVADHEARLSRLTVREATKHF